MTTDSVSDLRSADGIRVFGRAGSTEGYDVRDFLTRTVVEYEWVDLTCEDD